MFCIKFRAVADRKVVKLIQSPDGDTMKSIDIDFCVPGGWRKSAENGTRGVLAQSCGYFDSGCVILNTRHVWVRLPRPTATDAAQHFSVRRQPISSRFSRQLTRLGRISSFLRH